MKRVNIIIVVLLGMFILVCISIFRNFDLSCKFYKISFKGEITDVKYSERNLADIKINNKYWQYLGTNILYEEKIEKGDSIFKKSHEFDIYLKKGDKVYNIASKRNNSIFMKSCHCEKKEKNPDLK